MSQKRVSINCIHTIDVMSIVILSELHLNYRVSEILFILFKYVFELKGRKLQFEGFLATNFI